jgi:hypothetical protein
LADCNASPHTRLFSLVAQGSWHPHSLTHSFTHSHTFPPRVFHLQPPIKRCSVAGWLAGCPGDIRIRSGQTPLSGLSADFFSWHYSNSRHASFISSPPLKGVLWLAGCLTVLVTFAYAAARPPSPAFQLTSFHDTTLRYSTCTPHIATNIELSVCVCVCVCVCIAIMISQVSHSLTHSVVL